MFKWFPRNVLFIYIIHATLIAAAFYFATRLPSQPALGFVNPLLPTAPDPWTKLIRWDAHWYTYIAAQGYTAQSIVFFPALILMLKAAAYLGVDIAVAGLIICNAAAVLSFILLYNLLRLDLPPSLATRGLLAYAVMPTSFFLHSIYTEPVFLTLALGCIYCTSRRKWWLAGILAASTTLTRNLGIGLLLFMAYEYYRGTKRPGITPLISLLLAPAALLGFVVYNYRLTGDALAFVNSQALWGRNFGLPWANILHNVMLIIRTWPHVEPAVFLDTSLVFLGLSGLIFLTLSPRYRIRHSYLIIGWLWFLIPLFSTSPTLPLYSMSRFVLVIFPLYFFLAQLPSAWFRLYTLAGMATMVYFTALFINWYWVG